MASTVSPRTPLSYVLPHRNHNNHHRLRPRHRLMISYPTTQLLIPVSQIFIDSERRPTDDDKVRRMAEDIDCLGLINLPTFLDLTKPKSYPHIREYYNVPKNFSGYFLVTGAHRTVAMRDYHKMDAIPGAIHAGPHSISRKMQQEWTENNTRFEESWQERCLALLKIHRQITREKLLLENKRWTALATGSLLDLSRAHISTMLKVAEELEDKNSPCWACPTLSAAYALILKEAETLSVQELNRRKRDQRMAAVTPEALAELRAAPKGMTAPAYVEKIGKKTSAASVVEAPALHRPDLGLYCEDCRLTMPRLQSNYFDAIITDPMYGIDAKNISNRNHGFLNKFVGIQKGEHPFKEIELIIDCLPDFFRILKENAWFVFWYDIEHHEKLLLAVKAAGFKVQDWPVIWIKTHACRNDAAKFNTTKNYEIAMICRKGNSTLLDAVPRSTFAANRDDCDFVKANKDHPFVKPFLAWDFLLQKRLHPGAKLYEPFAGRGSLLHAAYRNGMNVVASERETDHFAYLVRNVTLWQADATSSQTPTETTTEQPS